MKNFVLAMIAVCIFFGVIGVILQLAENQEAQLGTLPSLRTEAGVKIMGGTLRRYVDHEAGIVHTVLYDEDGRPVGISSVAILDTEFAQ